MQSRTSAAPPRHPTFLQVISGKLQAVAEAKQCLTDIENAVQIARTYLKYLEDVAQVVKAYVEGTEAPRIDTSGRPPLPELKDANAAKDYLSNLTTAYSAAENYLNYLEGVAANVREYLNKWESSTQEEVQQETKTRNILSELEETALAAKKYLVYLKGVASAVEKYLADPSRPPPPELANLESVEVPPAASLPPSFETPFPATANGALPDANAPSSFGGPSYIDRLASTENAQPPPVNGGALGSGSYLESMSPASPSLTGASGGSSMKSFADSMSSSTTVAATEPAPVPEPVPTESAKPQPKSGEKSSSPNTTSQSSPSSVTATSDRKSSTRGSGQQGYLDSIQSDSSTLQGSGVAQKRYTDNLRSSPTTPKAKNAPSGYLETLNDKSKGTTNVARDSSGDDDAMGAGLSVFLSLIFVSVAALFQWYNTDPGAVDAFLQSVNVNIPIEKALSRPKVVEEMANPPAPLLLPPPRVEEQRETPPLASPEAPVSPTAPSEANPLSPTEDPEFDDWEF